MLGKQQCDVIVIGAGSAAFEAAVAAREAGAERVVMLEKAPEAQFGGNARYSHTGFRFVHSGAEEIREFISHIDQATFDKFVIPPYTRDQFLADLNRVTQNRIDPVLAACLVDRSNAAVHWMKKVGVKWENEKVTRVGDRLYMEPGINIHPIGGGLGMLLALRDIAVGMGVEVRYESRVRAVHGNERRIEGVRVSTPDGEYDLFAPSVVCCSGGFQASPAMRARYLSGNTDFVKVRGSRHNTGEVLHMMLDLGAAAAGQWQGAHMSPIDAGAPSFETPTMHGGKGNAMNRYDYIYGVTVNQLGRRFFDEGEAKISYTYAKTGRAILQEPGGAAYQIYDQNGIDYFRHGRDYAATVHEAPTIAELAVKIGIQPEILVDEIGRFNAACRRDVPFDASKPDGKHTEGLAVRKSNWAVPIEKGPFRAYPVTTGVTFSFGGLKIDDQARVLSSSFEPIRGLYASGDVVGLFFHNYPSCTGQTRNAVFSTLAGTNAAKLAN